MGIVGLDLGSRQVKLAYMEAGEIVKKQAWHTAQFYRQFCRPGKDGKGLGLSLEDLGIESAELMISTGYGRNNTNLNGFIPINEIKAHAIGAQYQTAEKDFVLLDVGGQDVKVMRIKSGQLIEMNLNDKCAASCGRFLEQMAEVLDISLGELTSHYTEPVTLSSTCAVFCESELIGKMAEGHEVSVLAAGVNRSLFKRLQPMLSGFEDQKLFLSGGVAKSQALHHFLKEIYETVEAVNDPVYNGAIGCCDYGRVVLEKREK